MEENLDLSIAEELRAVMAEQQSEADDAEAPQEASEPVAVAEAEGGEDTPIEQNAAPAEAEEASEDAEPETVFQAPEHWSSELKEQFAALDPTAQEILLARDKEFQTGYQERAQSVADLQKAFEPYQQVIAQMGVSEAQAIRSLMSTYSQLLQNPLDGIRGLAQNFGVLDQLVAPDTDDLFIDPNTKALQQEISSLKNQITNLSQTQQQTAQERGYQMLEDFRSAKDDKGQPLRPYFDDALPLINSLVQQGETLEAAYEQAKWSVPAYRESQAAQKSEPSEAERLKKVRQAKKAAEAVKPSGKAPEAPQKELTRRDELAEVWNELTQ
jgi:signal transduction histidine kinase